MQTDKPHEKDFQLAFPLLSCLNMSTNKMQLILPIHMYGRAAEHHSVQKLQFRPAWEGKRKVKRFWGKTFFFFQIKITSLFLVGTLHILTVPCPFQILDKTQDLIALISLLSLDSIHQQLCSQMPHNWFLFLSISHVDTPCWLQIKAHILHLMIVPINLN